MADFKVSHRYATSLLETALEKNKLDKIAVYMLLVVDILEDSKDLSMVL
jgi:F0F1-type ATP synthase delta subunit